MKQINSEGVPLMSEHQKTWDAKLGEVVAAWMDDRDQLHIKAKLDKDSSRAVDLYKALKKGLQVGLSVAGVVKRSAHELVESLGKRLKTFYDVALKEISVTNRPSNFDTWIIAKGQTGSLEGHLFEKPHRFYEEYLQNYPSLDWQFEIAKSVAEVSKDMPEEIKKDEAAPVPGGEGGAEAPVETPAPVEAPVSAPEAAPVVESAPVVEAAPVVEEKSVAKAMSDFAKEFNSLATEIRNLLKQSAGKATQDSETSTAGEKAKKAVDTSTTTTEEKAKKPMETTTSTEEKAKKPADETTTSKECATTTTTEEKAKKPAETSTTSTMEEKMAAKKPAKDDDTSTEDTDDETTKSIKLHTLAQTMAEELQKRYIKKGRRIMGPLVDEIEKMLQEPKARKGIASETAYKIEKGFVGNPEEVNGVEKSTEVEEVEKDLKDKEVGFKDFFKKHYSTFKEEGDK